jgi:hypothetical protein
VILLVSRASVYGLLTAGELPAIRVGGHRVVSRWALLTHFGVRAAALSRAVGDRSLEGALDFRLSLATEAARDKGVGVEAERVEVARLINDSMVNKGPERGPTGPDAAPER